MPDPLASEPAIRLAAFAGVFLVMAVAEMAAPRRTRAVPRYVRWTGNLGLAAIDTLAVRVVFPTAAVGAALWAQANGIGLLNLAGLPAWLAVILAFLALDFAIWAQHLIFHKVPALWRLHRVHHADTEFDVTTAVRFHPIEILVSMAIKIVLVVALGAPALAVLIFEIALNATAMFNHANVALPAWLDRIVRLVVVTPDMHRVHHSVHRVETDSNFGFNLPVWDRLFGTYRPEPRDGHTGMTIGLAAFRDPAERRLDRLLTQPFRTSSQLDS